MKKKKKIKQQFYNQATIIVKPKENIRNINIKIFTNGSISMTGCASEEDGSRGVQAIIDELKTYPEKFVNSDEIKDLELIDYAITLINTDFTTSFKIMRDKLYDIIINKYNIFVTFEPVIYPGVKISYMWNKN